MNELRRGRQGVFRWIFFPFALFSLGMGGAGLLLGSPLVLQCALCTFVYAAVVCVWLSQRIQRSLEGLGRGIQAVGAGRSPPDWNELPFPELTGVKKALYDLSHTLSRQQHAMQDRQEREETIFASMMEGLIAVDPRERVIRANQAALPLMRVPLDQVIGRSAQEVFRYAGLHRFLRKLLAGEGTLGEEIELHDEQERVLQAQGATLRNADGAAQGAVIVLHDITRLRRLEQVRKEFVANVSHELKTPATSIRGFVETLQDGAVNDPAQARRFLDILMRQSERLQSIVEDLLVLSRVEEQVGRRDFPAERTPILPILETAVQFCSLQSHSGQIPVTIDCDDALEAYVNSPLVEQAVVNLIDNAVKYGGPDNQVQVRGVREDGSVMITVRDRGPGISREHLPRVFERFYRVDKARSRARGGTGLGLAIVKHIAQAHGGRADVISRPGEGALFRLILPDGAPAKSRSADG